jgi:hypothetical protein
LFVIDRLAPVHFPAFLHVRRQSTQERALFRRLAVFAGGFSLEAVEAVCAGDGTGVIDPADVLDLLTKLVDKSLVTTEVLEHDLRYRMLETIRQYGRERLLESGEADAFRTRHLDWYLATHRTGITFDRVGLFGYQMIVTCANGKVWRVNAAGTPSLVADVAAALGLASVRIENPAVAPPGFAPYGGHALVAAAVLGKVLAISPAGAVADVANWHGAKGVYRIPADKCDFGMSGGSFFAAIRAHNGGQGTIYKFPISSFGGLSGRALVTSESGAGIGLLTPTGAPAIIPSLFHASIGQHEGAAFADCSVPLLLGIIVKPGSIPHTINPRSKGTVPVAVLSSPIFNALTDVELASIRFGVTGTEHSIAFCNRSGEDVNGDGRLDLICHGETRKLGITTHGVYRGPLIVKLMYNAPGGDPPGEGLD